MKLICNFNTFISAHPQHLLNSVVPPTHIKGKKMVHADKQTEMIVNSFNVRSEAPVEVTSISPHLNGELIRAFP